MAPLASLLAEHVQRVEGFLIRDRPKPWDSLEVDRKRFRRQAEAWPPSLIRAIDGLDATIEPVVARISTPTELAARLVDGGELDGVCVELPDPDRLLRWLIELRLRYPRIPVALGAGARMPDDDWSARLRLERLDPTFERRCLEHATARAVREHRLAVARALHGVRPPGLGDPGLSLDRLELRCLTLARVLHPSDATAAAADLEIDPRRLRRPKMDGRGPMNTGEDADTGTAHPPGFDASRQG